MAPENEANVYKNVGCLIDIHVHVLCFVVSRYDSWQYKSSDCAGFQFLQRVTGWELPSSGLLRIPSSGAVDSWPLKMGPVGCPETSVRNYFYPSRKNPEERSSLPLRGGCLKSRLTRCYEVWKGNKLTVHLFWVIYFQHHRYRLLDLQYEGTKLLQTVAYFWPNVTEGLILNFAQSRAQQRYLPYRMTGFFVPYRCQSLSLVRLRLKCDGTRAETRFCLSAKRTSPYKSAGALVQSTTGSRGVRVSGNIRGGVKGTAYPLHSPVSPSLPLPCVTVCHHVSIGLYQHRGTALSTSSRFCLRWKSWFEVSAVI